jgi:hypothetical protein
MQSPGILLDLPRRSLILYIRIYKDGYLRTGSKVGPKKIETGIRALCR